MPLSSSTTIPSLWSNPLRTLRQSLRTVKRSLAPPSIGTLPEAQTVGTLKLVQPPAALEAGVAVKWNVLIENRSSIPWPIREPYSVQLVAQWKRWDGMLFGEAQRFPMPTPAYPGEPLNISILLVTPIFVGDYHVDFCLEQNTAPLIGTKSHSPNATLSVPVVGSRSTDIDYHAVFRNASLDDNHWWVVGAYHSKEQYEKSQQERLGMLVQHGFTADSHLLDVGCGTGQMAAACEKFLSPHGGYAGTDIGKEAIDFCRKQFLKPGYRFEQGGLTTIPFQETDGRFDMAIYFSVFTHTYADETALLFAETKRLLKPNGIIIADAITSPLVERGAGHRGEMVLNPNHYMALARAIGFEGEIIGRWPWNSHAERLMVKFRQVR